MPGRIFTSRRLPRPPPFGGSPTRSVSATTDISDCRRIMMSMDEHEHVSNEAVEDSPLLSRREYGLSAPEKITEQYQQQQYDQIEIQNQGKGDGRSHDDYDRFVSHYSQTNKRRRGIYMLIGIKLLFLFFTAAWLLCRLFPGSGLMSLVYWYSKHNYHNHPHYIYNDREVIIDGGRRSIWGKYPLLDLLSLTTTSGSVVVAINPQPADPWKPDEPARLRIRTNSGSVSVSFDILDSNVDPVDGTDGDGSCLPLLHLPDDGDDDDDIRGNDDEEEGRLIPNQQQKRQYTYRRLPPRPYEIDISTKSGSVSGRLLFTTSTKITTGSGTISTVLVPVVYYDPDNNNNNSHAADFNNDNISIYTHTGHTGSQNIRLTRPIPISPPPNGNEYQQNHLESSSSSTTASTTTTTTTTTSTSTAQPLHPPQPKASHITDNGGSMNIRYPPNWAGTVQAYVREGRICLDGKELKVTRSGDGYMEGFKRPNDGGGQQWWGGTGDMNVSLLVGGVGGSVDFLVG